MVYLLSNELIPSTINGYCRRQVVLLPFELIHSCNCPSALLPLHYFFPYWVHVLLTMTELLFKDVLQLL